MFSTYSLDNLIHATEYLSNLVRTLNSEITVLQKLKNEVSDQQQEAHKQGHLVKKMTNYLSDELGRMELGQDSTPVLLGDNLEKLSETETKLRILRGRLSEFVDGNDADSLRKSDSTIANDLKHYESFLLDLTGQLNEKIPKLEKMTQRIKAENREAQQQKLLLKEMVELFNDELEDLDSTFSELKKRLTVS